MWPGSPAKSSSTGLRSSLFPLVKEHRFLGIIIDHCFSGKSHLEWLIRKCRSICNMVASLAGIWWGSHPLILLKIYRAVMRSTIDYGHQVLFFQKNHTRIGVLLKLRNRALRAALGYRQSTPINVILGEAKEPPFHARIEYLNTKFLCKCFSRSECTVLEDFEAVVDKANSSSRRAWLLRNIPIFKTYIKIKGDLEKLHQSKSLPCFLQDFETLLFRPPCVDLNLGGFPRDISLGSVFRSETELLTAGAVTFYTDGSRRGCEESLRVGLGVYSPELDIRVACRLDNSASIFTAEAMAIKKAFELILDNRSVVSKAVIFSDSRSVLEALTSMDPFVRGDLVPDLRNLARHITVLGVELIMAWIPSHRGIEGNVMADFLAGEATLNKEIHIANIPYTDCFSIAKEISNRVSNSYFQGESLPKGKFYHLYFHSTAPKPWFHKIRLKRSEIVLINRIRSNHCNLNFSLFRKNMIDSPSCPCGYDSQDVNHVIFVCPLYKRSMAPFLNFVNSKHPDHPVSDIAPIIVCPSPKICRLLLASFKSASLLI
ncbi:PREDICTED: uncharacterized protein LOC105556178 [Vollenhovia emeryi]|uniref:uncharacterized protein LOC105556178 n=1 Tax=Vollenhovia emeryi TaxID=411798 RepID=UPI0005F52199|nr:PREDICTED: uncharacterized protein LOC105556178 [Vollenhovia emeryi]